MICQRCNQIVDQKDALTHPKLPGRFFCPVCKRAIKDFGKERATISGEEKIKEFDQKKIKPRQIKINSFIDSTPIDLKIIECQDTLLHHPQDSNTRTTLINLLIQTRDFEAAYKECKTLIKQYPDSIEALTLLAQIYVTSGNIDRALKVFSKILQVDPNNNQIRYNLAVALFYKEKYQLALKHTKKVLLQDPSLSEAKDLLIRLKENIKSSRPKS